ncbi:MAG: ATP-binding cassette domain-containing protein [Cyclobacteriaceae bacterium]|nr:ATP-binding cassette domain-containing protein [Cyclobacteriaceae bacterium]
MSEELLKAVIQLFAIVARERITDDERNNIKEFLGLHLNREAIKYYLDLFDELVKGKQEESSRDFSSVDAETAQFLDEWAKIMQISKQVNQALTMQQKLVLIIKIIELVFSDGDISERQENLIYYIGQALKVPRHDINELKNFVTGQDIDELASQNVLIIDEGYDENPYPGPRIVEKNLTGLIAILRLPDSYFIKYLGISVVYLNSIHLKSRRIDVFPTGSTIRGDKIEPIYYSDIIGKFLAGADHQKLTFTADHIFYHFKSGKAGLQNINIAEKGGKLVGIMGASGSGKSTLLNVLNGVERPSSGRVQINGIDIHERPEEVQGIVGYIPQDDLLMEDLTVFENLYYAARLCFGQLPKEECAERVEKLLVQLGLAEIRNLKVGSPLQKIISGGQRKRLNIGLELLREPTILFVDEPTSGLSSRDSENIMDLLKELSLRGKMIFVVIHQPSSDIFKMFDTLVILDVGGFQIYYGNPVESVVYFRDIINAANKSQGACPECGNINPEQVFNIIETKVVNEYGRLTNTRKISAGQWYQYFKQRLKVPKVEHLKEPLPVAQHIATRRQQIKIFSIRDSLAKLANKQYLTINLLEAPVLAFFIAFMVKYYNILSRENPSYTFYENQNIPVFFFMSVVVALFFGLTVSAEEIFKDRKILKREQFLHLSRTSYLLSKITVLFTISAIQTVLFVTIGHLVLEIPLTEFRYWFILFSVACFANVLGLNISASFNSAVTIYILIPLLIIPQLLLSGVVIEFDKFNPRVTKPIGVPLMGNLMASRWAFEAYMVTQYKDNPFEQQFYELDKTLAQAEFKRVFLIPELESKLSYCLNNRNQWRNPNATGLTAALQILQNEIRNELTEVGGENFPDVDDLEIGKFDSVTHQNTARFLGTMKQLYLLRHNRAMEEKEKLLSALTATPADMARYEKMRDRYQNKAVADAVRNLNTVNRIVEFDGRFIQRIYPIYQDEHKPRYWLDFSANLYQPTKHFIGFNFDTLHFNLAVIWSMTIVLYITLYFDVLRKIMRMIENRRYKRVERT